MVDAPTTTPTPTRRRRSPVTRSTPATAPSARLARVQDRFDATLATLADDVYAAALSAAEGVEGPLTARRAAEVRRAVDDVMVDYWPTRNGGPSIIADQIVGANVSTWDATLRAEANLIRARLQPALAAAVVTGDDDMATFLRMATDTDDVRRAAAEAFDDTRSWIDPNGYQLSDRVWNAGEAVRRDIDATLRASIQNGADALRVATELRQYMHPDAAGRLTYAPYRGGAGAVGARRLARTEITRAFNESARTAHGMNPFVTGLRWTLSNRHPKSDVCDGYASADDHDLGPGVYPKDSTPTMPAHPNCLCTWTTTTTSEDDAIAALRAHYGLDGQPPRPVDGINLPPARQAIAVPTTPPTRKPTVDRFGAITPDDDADTPAWVRDARAMRRAGITTEAEARELGALVRKNTRGFDPLAPSEKDRHRRIVDLYDEQDRIEAGLPKLRGPKNADARAAAKARIAAIEKERGVLSRSMGGGLNDVTADDFRAAIRSIAPDFGGNPRGFTPHPGANPRAIATLDGASTSFPRGAWERVTEKPMDASIGGRGGASAAQRPWNTIRLDDSQGRVPYPNGHPGTAVHESAHVWEMAEPRLRQLEYGFYDRRTANDGPAVPIPGYSAAELYRPDAWTHAYIGKDYRAMGYTDPPMELVSMGVEDLLGPVRTDHRIRTDTELVDFILGVLAGF